MSLTVEMLHRLLVCDPEAGRLFWKARTPDLFRDGYRSAAGNCANWNAQNAGAEAFTCVSKEGHRQGAIFNRRYYAHRVIWTMQSGAWPTEQIDHIDGNALNNSIHNLRAATAAQNARNRRSLSGSTSIYLGVCWDAGTSKWRAQIGKDSGTRHLGLFRNERDAALAYDNAARQMHGEFARLNFAQVAA